VSGPSTYNYDKMSYTTSWAQLHARPKGPNVCGSGEISDPNPLSPAIRQA
jgi:hypothetical protein